MQVAHDDYYAINPRDVGEMNQVQEVPPEIHVIGRGPVGLPVVVEVVVHEVVRRDIGRRGVEGAEREHAPPRHVEAPAVEDALVQVVVDDHRVKEAEIASRAQDEDVPARRHEEHGSEQAEIDEDDAYLAPLGGVLDEPRLPARAQDVPGVQVRRQQHMDRRRVRQFLQQTQTFANETLVRPVVGLKERLVAPVRRHRRQRPEGVRCDRRSPEATQKPGDHQILLGLRQGAQHRPWLAALEEHGPEIVVGFEKPHGWITIPES